MSVPITLELVDHDLVIVKGRPILARAAQSGDLGELRAHILSRPWRVDEEVLGLRLRRLAHLEQLHAPGVILEHERRMVSEARGENRTETALSRLGFDELRELLHGSTEGLLTYELSDCVDALHWCLDPGRRNREEPDWRPGPPSRWDHLFYCAEEVPLDHDDQPLWGHDEDRYSPPDAVRALWTWLEKEPDPGWARVGSETDVEPQVLDELRTTWANLRACLRRGTAEGFGVRFSAWRG